MEEDHEFVYLALEKCKATLADAMQVRVEFFGKLLPCQKGGSSFQPGAWAAKAPRMLDSPAFIEPFLASFFSKPLWPDAAE